MSCPNYTWKYGYYCIKKAENIPDDQYYKYCRGYDYDDCSIYKYNPSSGCFITTVACEILGKKDNDKILNTLRKFRNDVLQGDEQYHNILKEYDTIGRCIALGGIPNDKYKEGIANCLYENTLTSVANLVEEGKYDEAVQKYHTMTLSLINRYGLNKAYKLLLDNDYYYKDFNPKTAGHGYKRSLIKVEK